MRGEVVLRRHGIDVIEIARMEAALSRSGPGFLARAFTPAEIAECGGMAVRLAGRWAAKEAVIKCFDATPICFPRRRIEILSGPGGAPRVRLLGDAQGARVQVTIAHDAGLAVAGAWLEMPEPWERPPAPPGAVRLPERPPDGHKGTFGTVVVVAGSRGLTGAAYLSATAGVRAGAGLVRLLVAEGIYPILAVKCTEAMATPLPEEGPGALGPTALGEIEEHLGTARAALLGPGLGRHPATWELVRRLVPRIGCPLVLDADALNALGEVRGRLGRPGDVPRVLTPHPGEMARLTGRSTREIQGARQEVAIAAAREWEAVVVLKGARTVVAAPDGRRSEDPHQVPALASGGTGDVLGGLIAGLIAQGLDPYTAAVTGVYVHAEAGRRLEARLGTAGVLASELLGEIPPVMKTMRESR